MKSATATLVLCCLLSCGLSAQNYGKELTKEFKKVFDLTEENGPYRWYGYPVDNFGILTSYDPPDGKLVDSSRVCATWTCIDVPKDKVPTGEARINVNGFADPGLGGSFVLDDKHKRSLLLSLILPQLAKLVDLNGSFNWSKEVDSQITVGKGWKRSVDRDKFQNFLANDSKNRLLKSDFSSGRLTYVAADIVIENLQAKLTVNSKTSAQAKATLDKAAQAFSSGSSSEVSFSSEGNGTYTINIPFPVVIATQMRKQPAALTLAKKAGRELVNVSAPRPVLANLWK